MGTAAWIGIIKEGWPVLLVLLAMSVVTVAVAIEKWRSMARIESDARPFLESMKRTNDVQKVIAFCEKSTQPLAFIAKSVLQAPARREDKERVLQRSIQTVVRNLDTRMTVLGTVASIAPFVGLLGTVLGIIKSFRAFSAMSESAAGKVTMGISEALVGTAAGLVVAIPAVLFYNYFVNKIRRLTQDWELAGAEIIDMSLER